MLAKLLFSVFHQHLAVAAVAQKTFAGLSTKPIPDAIMPRHN